MSVVFTFKENGPSAGQVKPVFICVAGNKWQQNCKQQKKN